MTHLVVLNVVFFILPTCGATAFSFLVWRFLRGDGPTPEAAPPGGGSEVPVPSAGPHDLARSA